MCYERYERRRREADESREMWRDFARTTPVRDPEPADEVSEPETTEAREATTAPER
jgi:hypothetical protein